MVVLKSFMSAITISLFNISFASMCLQLPAEVKRLEALRQIKAFITLSALTLDAVEHYSDCDCD